MSRDLEERNRTIYEMFTAGYSMNQIAENFGVTRQRVGQIISQYEHALPEEDTRTIQRARLESLIASVHEVIRKGPIPKTNVKGEVCYDTDGNQIMDYETFIKAIDEERRLLESQRRLDAIDLPRRKAMEEDIAMRAAKEYLASLPRADVVE